MDEWPGQRYDLLRHNCCSFSQTLCERLGVKDTPGWLHRLADTGAALAEDKKAIVHGLHVFEVLFKFQSFVHFAPRSVGDRSTRRAARERRCVPPRTRSERLRPHG